ncbi:MAG: PhzF family phenazine biosynthesis protein, partial [Clostridium sp.]
NLKEKDMISIAKKLGFSETAFVQSSNVADFKVRFFTPSEEVDLCGHATIATFYVLTKLGIIIHFAPLYDIPEESATGTSNGALSCYLFKYGRVSEEKKNNLIFEQGYSMNRPSEIRASLTTKDDEIIEVKVGGNASDLKVLTLEI